MFLRDVETLTHCDLAAFTYVGYTNDFHAFREGLGISCICSSPVSGTYYDYSHGSAYRGLQSLHREIHFRVSCHQALGRYAHGLARSLHPLPAPEEGCAGGKDTEAAQKIFSIHN